MKSISKFTSFSTISCSREHFAAFRSIKYSSYILKIVACLSSITSLRYLASRLKRFRDELSLAREQNRKVKGCILILSKLRIVLQLVILNIPLKIHRKTKRCTVFFLFLILRRRKSWVQKYVK